jgi:hypothetical protein
MTVATIRFIPFRRFDNAVQWCGPLRTRFHSLLTASALLEACNRESLCWPQEGPAHLASPYIVTRRHPAVAIGSPAHTVEPWQELCPTGRSMLSRGKVGENPRGRVVSSAADAVQDCASQRLRPTEQYQLSACSQGVQLCTD